MVVIGGLQFVGQEVVVVFDFLILTSPPLSLESVGKDFGRPLFRGPGISDDSGDDAQA